MKHISDKDALANSSERISVAIKNMADYQLIKKHNFKNLILGASNFSRMGEFNKAEFKEVVQDALASGIHVEIEVDIFPTQEQFEGVIQSWLALDIQPHGSLSIRVLDLGLMDWFFNNSYQLIPLLEAGFHNLSSIQNLFEQYETSISHLVLSKELIFNKQIQYANDYLHKSVEFNILAPILLLYSPRKLLQQYYKNNAPYIQTLAASQESVHRGFVVRENQWGSLFYHPKHQCLISKIDELANQPLVKLALDLRLIEVESLRHDLIALLNPSTIFCNDPQQVLEQITALFPFPLTRGFFDVNKTDVLFSKLKNHHAEHANYHRVAEVMDMVKGEGMIIRILDGVSLHLGDKLYLQSPQGNSGTLTLTKLVNLQNMALESADENTLVKINYIKHFPSQSSIFKIYDNIIS